MASGHSSRKAQTIQHFRASLLLPALIGLAACSGGGKPGSDGAATRTPGIHHVTLGVDQGEPGAFRCTETSTIEVMTADPASVQHGRRGPNASLAKGAPDKAECSYAYSPIWRAYGVGAGVGSSHRSTMVVPPREARW